MGKEGGRRLNTFHCSLRVAARKSIKLDHKLEKEVFPLASWSSPQRKREILVRVESSRRAELDRT